MAEDLVQKAKDATTGKYQVTDHLGRTHQVHATSSSHAKGQVATAKLIHRNHWYKMRATKLDEQFSEELMEQKKTYRVTDHTGKTHEVLASNEHEAKKRVVDVNSPHVPGGVPMSKWSKVKVHEEVELEEGREKKYPPHPRKKESGYYHEVVHGDHHVFGADSGHSYGSFSSEKAAKEHIAQLNEVTSPGAPNKPLNPADAKREEQKRKTWENRRTRWAAWKAAQKKKVQEETEQLEEGVHIHHDGIHVWGIGKEKHTSLNDAHKNIKDYSRGMESEKRGEKLKASLQHVKISKQHEAAVRKHIRGESGYQAVKHIRKYFTPLKESTQLNERTLTAAETAKKEEIVKSMKKKKAGFKERYGSRAKEVMYATATKQAKKVQEESFKNYLGYSDKKTGTPVKVSTKKEIGYKIADIGPGGKEHNVKRVGPGSENLEETSKTFSIVKDVLNEAMTRKHFRQVADIIKQHPDLQKRKELASHHSEIFSKANPRFDKKRFYAAAGVEHD